MSRLRASMNGQNAPGAHRHVEYDNDQINRRPIGCRSRRKSVVPVRVCHTDAMSVRRNPTLSSARHMGFIADIGTVLRLTPDDDLQIVLGDGVYCNSDDRTPFNFQVQGRIYDGQLFYGLFGPVLSGPSRYERLICNILVRTDATDWWNETRSQVNFKVGRSVVIRNHYKHFNHPDGTCLEGYPRISRFGMVEVVNVYPTDDT